MECSSKDFSDTVWKNFELHFYLDTEYELKLSDAYIDKGNEDNLSLELKVKVININSKAGNDILKRCNILNEYTIFVEKVRELKDLENPNYMEEAIKYCIEHHILEEYLSRKGSEVMGFLCAEYDHEMALEVRGEEKYEDGFNDGIEKEKTQSIKNMLKKLSVEEIVELGYEKELVEKLAKENC